MTSYSPSSSTAWGSVFYISHEMWGGWFIRGVHHFAAQAMVVLLVMHLLQVLWAGAYRRPRELNWWFGMALLFLTLGFSLTGYLLPWDQKGYWATKVATNIMGERPASGPTSKKSSSAGPTTATRRSLVSTAFTSASCPCCSCCAWLPCRLFRRHGITTPAGSEKRPGRHVLARAALHGHASSRPGPGRRDRPGPGRGRRQSGRPRRPASSDYPARPEWYFLSLFQMLKLFPGSREIIGTFVIPTALVVVMMLLPLLDRVLPRKLAHFLACGFVFAVVGAAGYLTVQAMLDDRRDELFQKAEERRRRPPASALPRRAARRRHSARRGRLYPPPRSAHPGHSVLERRCLGCHVFDGKGTGTQTASDLKHFGTREWVRGLLENPASASYFGKVKSRRHDGMEEELEARAAKELDKVADFVATFASIPEGHDRR